MTEQLDKRPVVLAYYTYSNRIGGPLTYIRTLENSSVQEHYRMEALFQEKAPGGLDLGLLRDMTRAIKKMAPDIVHIHGVQSEGFYGALAAKLAGCKHIVMTVHGFAHDAANCTGIKYFLYKYIVEPMAIRWSNRVYCVCDFAAQRPIVQRNAGKRNWGYIHNCVPAMRLAADRTQMRRELGFTENEKVFAICGRVTRDKGFDILEKMIPQIKHEDFRLLVIGDGDYRGTFEDNMASYIRSGRITMVGQTDRVADYLAASDGFIFPSYHENLSIALLEACASGLACVVSDVGGNPEIILNGINGMVVKGQAPGDYASAVRELLENPVVMKRYQDAAKLTASEHFSKERMAEEVRKVYDSCILRP